MRMFLDYIFFKCANLKKNVLKPHSPVSMNTLTPNRFTWATAHGQWARICKNKMTMTVCYV